MMKKMLRLMAVSFIPFSRNLSKLNEIYRKWSTFRVGIWLSGKMLLGEPLIKGNFEATVQKYGQ